MSTSSKIAFAIASLILGLMYIAPLWSITLEAPQYPEGIGMYIQIDNVTGHKLNDLKNINGLNHYIGMKTIEPDTIAELKIMPWLIGFLIAFGLIGAALGKRWMLYAWAGAFLIAACVGLVDFYLWEYDYGHNLDPTAAIKVPGMNYQPPLIGPKKLLNFTAHSWPALGGWAAFLSLAMGLTTSVIEWKRARQTAAQPRHMAMAVAGLLLLTLGACTPQPKPLVHGQDNCAYCKMGLANDQYGAELVTTKGKTYAFDSIECMAAHLVEERTTTDDVHSLWVVDFQHPPNLIAVDDAILLHSRDLRSPMGMNLTAFGPGITQQAVEHSFYGDVLEWRGVVDLVDTTMLGDGVNPHATLQPTGHRPSQ